MEGRDTTILNNEIDATKSGIKILSLKTFHDDSQGSKRGDNLLFKFTLGNIKFCHLGDLGHVPDEGILKQLGDVDILFVPVGNVFTIGPTQAWKVIKAIKPNVAIPMHYRVGGLSLSIKPVEPFLEIADVNSVVRVGNEMDLEREDLPEKFEVWVFTL